MFKTKEKTEVENVIEDAKSLIKYYESEIDRYGKTIKDYRLKILKEHLLIEELTNQQETTKNTMVCFDDFIKMLKTLNENHNKGKN